MPQVVPREDRNCNINKELHLRRVITAEIVTAEFNAGRATIAAARGQAVITPSAWSRARELGVTFEQGTVDTERKSKRRPGVGEGSCERIVDPSGLVVVRGRSVRLGEFSGAGPDKHIGLLDLVTGGDGSPMTAGIMSWRREDSFAWHLDYDEVDLVVEGVLQITIDGRVLEGRAGDVFYIPKGSSIVFATPSRTRVFYVTYPANWAGNGTSQVRPKN